MIDEIEKLGGKVIGAANVKTECSTAGKRHGDSMTAWGHFRPAPCTVGDGQSASETGNVGSFGVALSPSCRGRGSQRDSQRVTAQHHERNQPPDRPFAVASRAD